MIKHYEYELWVTGSNGVGQVVTGSISCEFHDILDNVMKDTIQKLSIECDGIKCTGPYDIRRMLILRDMRGTDGQTTNS